MESSELIADFDRYCEELLSEGEKELKAGLQNRTRRWAINHILQLHYLMQRRKDELLWQYKELDSQKLGFVIYSKLNEYKHRQAFLQVLAELQE